MDDNHRWGGSSQPFGPDRWHAHSDAELVRATATDPEAFGELFRRQARPLYAQLRLWCHDPQDAFDLLSETFADALDQLDRYDPERGVPGAWLHGIARRKFLRFVRSGAIDARARERLRIRTPVLPADATERIDAELDLAAHARALRAAVGALAPRNAEAVALHFFEGLDYAGVAERLGIREEAARKRIRRGILRLGRSLGNDPTGTQP